MKFGQSIEYNIKNIFLEESYSKCEREASRRVFHKKSKLRISLDQQSKILYSFYCMFKWGTTKIYKKFKF